MSEHPPPAHPTLRRLKQEVEAAQTERKDLIAELAAAERACALKDAELTSARQENEDLRHVAEVARTALISHRQHCADHHTERPTPQ